MNKPTETAFDARWFGDFGIGRFARMLDRGLGLKHLSVGGKPWSPIDPIRLSWAMSQLPRRTAVLCPGYNAPLFITRPYVFTILDLIYVDCRDESTALKRLYYSLVVRRAAQRAFRVLTISEFSRRRIVDWCGVKAEKVVNVGCGVESHYVPSGRSYSPGYPYFLCVSNRKPHKNEERLLTAFASAKIDPSLRLIFTGQPNIRLRALSTKLGLSARVDFVGHVPEDRLPALYRGARALLFPSLYEGFGLPVVEAMACGTPVLTANTSALAEVAQDAAVLVDPLSVEAIAKGIRLINESEPLRAHLVEKGLRRAADFTWEAVVSKVRGVLEELTALGGLAMPNVSPRRNDSGKSARR